jgi:hypothetical protein
VIVVNFIHINFSKTWSRLVFHYDIFFFNYDWVRVYVFSTAFIGRLHLLRFLQRNTKLVFQFIIAHYFLLIWRILEHLLRVTLHQSIIGGFKIRSVRKFIDSGTLMTLQFTVRIRNFLFYLNEFVVTAIFEPFFRIIRIVILELLVSHKIVFNDIL